MTSGDPAIRKVEQVEHGWLWSIQLPEAPEFFEVGVAADELAALGDTTAAIRAWRKSPLYETVRHA